MQFGGFTAKGFLVMILTNTVSARYKNSSYASVNVDQKHRRNGGNFMLKIGTRAPNFTLQDQNGQERSLSEFQGQKVVLYFYSRDMTSGCSKQACGFAELYPQFTEKGAVVIGVSKDTVASHKKFEEKYNLPFVLLADPEKAAIQAYDVWKEQNMYGMTAVGVVRTTYLIDENGIIVKAFTDVNAVKNPQQMLNEL